MTALLTARPAHWDAVPGQAAAVKALRTAASTGELAHAWLMVGPQDVGQAEIAAALIAGLECAEAADGQGCGACDICTRVARNTYPNMMTFEPEGRWHVVDSVRSQWLPAVSLTAAEGAHRVIRIVAADRMNEATQNAFLKILEEPPPNVVWLLEAENVGVLLDTIISRCRRVDLGPLALATLTAEATQLGASAESAAVLARASMGSRRRLRDLMDIDVTAYVAAARDRRDSRNAKKPTDDDLEEQRHNLSASNARHRHLRVIADLIDQGPGTVTGLAKTLDAWARARGTVQEYRNDVELETLSEQFQDQRGRAAFPPGMKARIEKQHKRRVREERTGALMSVLDDIASYLRDMLAISAGAGIDALVNIDQVDQIRFDAARVPTTIVLDGLTAIRECREALEANGNPVLQLERLLMRIALPLFAAARA